MTFAGMGRSDVQEVSFQWFATHLLSKHVVEKLEVTNKSTVKVYVRPLALRDLQHAARRAHSAMAGAAAAASSTHAPHEAAPGDHEFFSEEAPPTEVAGPSSSGPLAIPQVGPRSVYKFYFNIGSVDAFERKMEEAQAALGWKPEEYIPITYTSEFSWQAEIVKLLPLLLIVGGMALFTRRQMGAFGAGPGGMGGRGIFNVGKAQVCLARGGDYVRGSICVHGVVFV